MEGIESNIDKMLLSINNLTESFKRQELKVDELSNEVNKLKNSQTKSKTCDKVEIPIEENRESSEINLNPNSHDVEKKVVRIIKNLPSLNNSFEPSTEQEYDEILDLWEWKSMTLGFNSEILKYVLIRLSSRSVLENIKQLNVNIENWNNIRDKVAKKLFPDSRQIFEIEDELNKIENNDDVLEQFKRIQRLIDRYECLCIRHAYPNIMHVEKKKEFFLKKLNPILRIEIRSQTYQDTSLEQFKELCIRARKKQIDLDKLKSGLAVSYAEVSTEKIKEVLPVEIMKQGRCYNCKKVGHYGRNCPEPRVRCNNCGKVGHTEDTCFQLTSNKKVGKQTTHVRKLKDGVHIKVIDEASKKDLIESFVSTLNKQIETLDKAKNRAKENKDSKIVVEKNSESEREKKTKTGKLRKKNKKRIFNYDSSDEEDLIQTHCLDSYNTESDNLARIFVLGRIKGKSINFLVDCGAHVSIISTKTRDSLGLINLVQDLNINQKITKIQGINSDNKIIGIFYLPIQIGHSLIEHKFHVIDNNSYMNILGIDWMRIAEATVNLSINSTGISLKGKPINFIIEPMKRLSVSCLDTFNFKSDFESNTLNKLLMEYETVWKNPIFGNCKICSHKIKTINNKPIAAKPRKISLLNQKFVEEHVRDLLEQKVIRKSYSEWASPIVLVPKADGTIRMCIDYRPLNLVTKRDAYPIPRIDDLLNSMKNATIFSTLDLKSGFYQIPMAEKDINKTAFVTHEGLYEFVTMPFGLVNAPITFQRMMDIVLEPLRKWNCRVYIDDIIIPSSSFLEHITVLGKVFNRLIECGLFINIKKCEFAKKEIKYLGFIIGNKHIKVDENRKTSIANLERPKDVATIRRFLGCTGYFRKFIRNYSDLSQPLYNLIKKNVVWKWNKQLEDNYNCLKKALINEPVMLFIPDMNKEFTLDTDASDYAIGAILQQKATDGELKVVAYGSKIFTEQEQKWPIREKEAYAILWSVIHFQEYLRFCPFFRVRTDHQSLKWIWKCDNRK